MEYAHRDFQNSNLSATFITRCSKNIRIIITFGRIHLIANTEIEKFL